MVISMKSFAGLPGHLATEHIDWPLAAMVTGAAVASARVGGRLVPMVDPTAVRRAFGSTVLLMGIADARAESSSRGRRRGRRPDGPRRTFRLVCTRTTHCPVRRLVAHPVSGTPRTAGYPMG